MFSSIKSKQKNHSNRTRSSIQFSIMSLPVNTPSNELSLKALLQKNLNEKDKNDYPPTISYLRKLSGQEKNSHIVEIDHNYNKAWNKHPDGSIRSRPAKFLFMDNFPKHFFKPHYYDRSFDINNLKVVDSDDQPINENPFIKEAMQAGVKVNNFELNAHEFEDDDETQLDELPANQTGWTDRMTRLYTGAIRVLNADRLARLSYVDRENELILRKNLTEKTSSKFRYLFAAVGSWDFSLLNWLHLTLADNLTSSFLQIYVDAIQLLRQRLPSLVDKFFTPIKSKPVLSTKISKQVIQPDPIQTILNNYKPKRLAGSPLFLIVPNGPQIAHQFTSQRMKHWHSIFGSLGKVITINIQPNKKGMKVSNCLKEIRNAVKDKINECKLNFSENRPLVLVGFGHSSLIAASCALESCGQISATICLGFPLTGINGFRGVS